MSLTGLWPMLIIRIMVIEPREVVMPRSISGSLADAFQLTPPPPGQTRSLFRLFNQLPLAFPACNQFALRLRFHKAFDGLEAKLTARHQEALARIFSSSGPNG